MQRFTGRVALVTGAATGIGFGIAQPFGQRGRQEYLWLTLTRPVVAAPSRTLAAEGITARLAVADVGDEEAVAAAVTGADGHLGTH